MKKQLAEDMILFTDPIRERIKEIGSNETYLNKVIKEGGEKARESAAKTLKEVRSIIGFTNY
jgi:tryptophanyl-tRNA synthetase